MFRRQSEDATLTQYPPQSPRGVRPFRQHGCRSSNKVCCPLLTREQAQEAMILANEEADRSPENIEKKMTNAVSSG
jgi:hypothetical protein